MCLIGFKSASAGRFLKGDLMMKRELFSKLFVLILIITLTGSAESEIMALWNFGPDSSYYSEIISVKHIGVAGFPTLSIDGGDKDANGKDGVDHTDTEGNSHNSGQAAAWNDVSVAGALDAEFTVEINTTGWQDMAVRWDYFSDDSGGNRGPTSVDLHYRVNSGAWEELPSWDDIALTRDDAWHEFAIDLVAITDINNKAMVEFLFDDFDENDDNGEFLVDNIEITGTQIPEPGTLILVGLGGMILRRSRR